MTISNQALEEIKSSQTEPINITLDATMLDMFQVCAARFNYRFNLLKEQLEKPQALDKGGLVHAGLEAYYKTLADRETYPSFSSRFERCIEDMKIYALDSDLDREEVSYAIDTTADNIRYWKNTDETLTIEAVEQSFAYELYSDSTIRLIMIGKIDLIASDLKYSYLPYDHKTFTRDFPLKRKVNQFLNYSMATGSNIIMVNRVGFQKSLPNEKKFKRIPLSYDPLILEQWKQNVIKWAYLYLECAVTNSWPLNDTSCDKFNRLCEYYDVCDSSGEESKVYKLNTLFRTGEPWDVSKALSRKGKE